jgi:HPt (histidine-containing phosphotransfer) domain-containing protein
MSTPCPVVEPAIPALDAAAVAKLRELDPGGTTGVLVRVFGAYEKSLQQFVQQLQSQLAQPDADAVARLAHKVKSSSASVGALALARACEEKERRLRAGGAAQTHDVQILIDEAEAALVAVRAILAR